MFDGISLEEARRFRYATEEMASLWSDGTKWHLWQTVQAAAAAARGTDPKLVRLIETARTPTSAEVAEAEATTRHDVVAFNQVLRRNIMSQPNADHDALNAAASAVHQSMTSSDLVDSVNAVKWATAASLIERAGYELVRAMANHASHHRNIQCVDRTHGQYAEVTTWGRVMALRAFEVDQAVRRLAYAKASVGEVKLSGPIGDYKVTSEETEAAFAKLLANRTQSSLTTSGFATQIVNRSRLIELADACKALTLAIASLALEIRLRSQSGVDEVAEAKGQGERGSSSMPHKTNPVISEQLCGLHVVVKNQANAIDDSMPVWGARDISHSSVERMAVPTLLTVTHYAARTATRLVGGLVVNRFEMLAQLDRAEAAIECSAALNWLVGHRVAREAAWELVNQAFEEVRDNGGQLESKVPVVARRLRTAGTEGLNWAEMKLAGATKPGWSGKLWSWVEEQS